MPHFAIVFQLAQLMVPQCGHVVDLLYAEMKHS